MYLCVLITLLIRSQPRRNPFIGHVGNRFDFVTADICISQLLHYDAGAEFWGYYNQGPLEFYKNYVSHTKQLKK